MADFTKDFKRIDGLFRMYLDMEKGAPWLYVAKSQLGPEFIYFNHSVDGPVGVGHNRGRYGEETIVVLRKIFDKVEFVESNTSIYFDPQSPLARARNANISHAILASESIVAEDNEGVLIPATNLFMRESLTAVKFGERSMLGRLSESKTKVMRINGYPKNTAVITEYVYENQNPPHEFEADIADPRYITVQVQHTLLAMPESDFKPRLDDPRIGYFTHQITDMTSLDAAPFRDVIHRWNLVKQKPGTALSEPVEPIVFWIENTTPIEFRDTIRAAVLKWNEAFETAGFKDAVVVKQQPDDAKWDAGDIEHNVLRWTSSVNPPFGGYGPSFANPRTGQILGADIMLEYSYITKRLLTKKLYDDLGLATEQNAQDANKLDPHACLACNCARHGIQFGQTMLRLQKSDRIEVDRLVKESLYYLALHEVGHTLGLNHNFRASHLHTPETIHNAEITEKVGLTGSVMDYPPVNLAPKGVKQGQYFTTKPGPYDHWAINFGYSEALEDPVEEGKRLEAIASQSHKPELAFANDADDMRATGKAIDPRAMLFDMSSDPIVYGEQRCDMAKGELKNVLKDLAEPGKSWQEVAQGY
ncbi:MAG: zinc-dependent metalloprotease, partial [bacterium]